ncbi:MAG: hypothetical protein O2923_13555 [Verrucomicrobia bacterium]|nr:hypothetical protein [Verrucomicrobiota bacterium]MDA1086550.1 hypothetical protein [Verrucomicrobiota bacterium]
MASTEPALTDVNRMHKETLSDAAAYWRGDIRGPRLSVVAEPTYRQLFDHTRPDLAAVADGAVECIRADLASGETHVVPTVYADFGTISTAKLYGGTVIPPHDGGGVHIKPVVRDPGELSALRACPFEESDFQLAVDLHRMVCERLGSDAVFLRTPDFQGPMNTLALVMDQEELMMGMCTQPDAIHAALDKITTTLIDYHQRLRQTLGGGKVIGNLWPYTILPEAMGVGITQDMMPLLSAEFYRDFELPCLRRIADAFGGVQIHCCGKYAHHLPALRDSGIRILGLEFHDPFTPFADVHSVFGDDIVYIPYQLAETAEKANYVAYAEDLLRQGTPETRFWFAHATGSFELDGLRNCIRRVTS